MLQVNIVSSADNKAYVSDAGKGPLLANGKQGDNPDVFGMQIESWPQYEAARVVFKVNRKFVVVEGEGDAPGLVLATTKSGDASLFQLTQTEGGTWNFQSVLNNGFVQLEDGTEKLVAIPDGPTAEAFTLQVSN